MRGKSFPISLLFLTLSWPIRKILSHLWKRSSLFQSSLSYFDRTIPHPKYFIKNLPLQITFPPPRLYNSSVSHFEMAHRENKNGYLSFHFYLSEIRTRVLARPIKKRYLYFPPPFLLNLSVPCIFIPGTKLDFPWRRGSSRGKKRDKTFFPWWKNAHRLYYALMQDPCTQSFSRWIRNFHTCPDLARRSTVSSDFLFFPSIYTYYIYIIYR